MGKWKKLKNGAKDAANVASGGTIGAVQDASKGNYKGAAGNLVTGGLSGTDFGKGALGDAADKLGFGAGDTESTAKAEGLINDSLQNWNDLKAPEFQGVNYKGPDAVADVNASNVGPSAMNNIAVNPAYSKAQMAQMGALQQLAANGGHDAASDARLAQIRAAEDQNARGQRDAILQNAQARGMGGSGSSLLAQLTGSQGAIDRQSAQDLGVAGMEADKALSAGQGAASIGSNLENQKFGEQSAVAQANDAAARFNAANSTDVSKFNASKNQHVNDESASAYNQNETMNKFTMPQQSFGNNATIASGKSGAAGTGINYYSGKNANSAAGQAGKQQAVIGLGTQVAGAAFGAAHGGRVPGHAAMPGDSSLNDFVPVETSPDEVVVPRSLTHGTNAEIGRFVHHAPTIKPRNDKEAMLSALKHLSMHGKVG
jgi:hypothetical protein